LSFNDLRTRLLYRKIQLRQAQSIKCGEFFSEKKSKKDLAASPFPLYSSRMANVTKQIESAARRAYLIENVEFLNNLSLDTLKTLDVFYWNGLLAIASVLPSLKPLLGKMESLESQSFFGVSVKA
jgi:hypothetical protein